MLRRPAEESPSPADLSFRAIPHPPNRLGRLTLQSDRRSIAPSFSIVFVHWAFSAAPGWRQTVTAEFQSPHIFNCPDDLPGRGNNTKLNWRLFETQRNHLAVHSPYRSHDHVRSNMIGRDQFELIGRKHGGYASWAIWAEASDRPKSNVDDLSILDVATNPALLEILRNDVVMVGLNISRTLSERFRNFHDPSPQANDFKIRYAFTSTPYYGAYMTDIVKNIAMTKSTELMSYLRTRPDIICKSVDALREELRDLRAQKPTILAFGSAAHALLAKNLHPTEYSDLIRLTHYSHQIGKERYREKVLAQIRSHATENALPLPA